MRVLVCGGRRGVTLVQVMVVLDALRPSWPLELEIGEGDAPGVDRFAGEWAVSRGVALRKYPINNQVDGHKDGAPMRRNERMLDVFQPHQLVGFPGGNGTRYMMDIAHRAGVDILDVEFVPNGEARVHRWMPHLHPTRFKEFLDG
jgi:hypothetical protein